MHDVMAEIAVLEHMRQALQQLRTSRNTGLVEAALSQEQRVTRKIEELKNLLSQATQATLETPLPPQAPETDLWG